MIEIILRNYLMTVLDCPVYCELPPNHPDTYVVIEKTGSGITNLVKRATIACKSIAPSMQSAAELNEAVKEAMDGAISLDVVARAHLDSDYNYTDQSIKGYRYQAVFDIVHY